MKNIKLDNNSREFIKKNLLPSTIIGFIIYSGITLSLSIFGILIIKNILIDLSSYVGLGLILAIAGMALLLYVITKFAKDAIEFGKRISCLLSGEYKVTNSIVEGMNSAEGKIYSSGPMIKATSYVFKSDDGDTMILPQGRFRAPSISSGQHAWLINYGSQNSFSVDYVLAPEAINE